MQHSALATSARAVSSACTLSAARICRLSWKHHIDGHLLIQKRIMSSPSRLLRGRPTAPLPTQYVSNSLNSLHKSEVESIAQTSSPSFSGSKYSSTHSPARSTSVDVDVSSSAERVKNFLRFHRNFLEEFILEEVPQETLDRILIRKAQRKDSATGVDLIVV